MRFEASRLSRGTPFGGENAELRRSVTFQPEVGGGGLAGAAIVFDLISDRLAFPQVMQPCPFDG